MRRESGKLSSFNWKLVLMAGIFQILTLIFDQIVIQYEEKNREFNFKLISETEQRFAYTTMASRVGNSSSSFDDITQIIIGSNFTKEKRKFLFETILFDQTRLIQDIFRDRSVIRKFSNKTIRAENLERIVNLGSEKKILDEFNKKGGPEILYETYDYVSFYLKIVQYSFDNINAIKDEPNLTVKMDAGRITVDANLLLQLVSEYNTHYLHILNSDLTDASRVSEKKIDDINNDIASIQSNKQIMLLSGVAFQLLSLLCLLILFRNILSLTKVVTK